MEWATFKTCGKSEMLKGIGRWWSIPSGRELRIFGKNKESSLMRVEGT